ncbi:MAG: alpha/beta hydrolase [Acetatifactor sp.]|nr:alpha/beta hydrolase [Acetatifactor sp.]
MKKRRKQIIKENEVSGIGKFMLGGFPQMVAIDGKKKRNPVVIFLHGGPGSPFPFSVGCRGLFPEITESVTMVYWDQLGCGINNYPISDHFSIHHFTDMTRNLITEIKCLFPENQIILFGVSWGSILALKTITSFPVPVDRCVTYGQILCDITFNEEVYQALEASSMPARQREKLALIRQQDSHSIQDGKTIMRWLQKYTEAYQCKSGAKTPIGSVLGGMLTSPDYYLSDFMALFINGYARNTSLLEELFTIDLREDFDKVSIPYTILQGSTDIVASTAKIKDFTAQQQNPHITCKIIENCGHIPDARGMEIICQELSLH